MSRLLGSYWAVAIETISGGLEYGPRMFMCSFGRVLWVLAAFATGCIQLSPREALQATDAGFALDAHVTGDSGSRPDASGSDASLNPDAAIIGTDECPSSLEGAVFCDGFERSNLEGWMSTVTAASSTDTTTLVERQTARVYRGQAALRVVAAPGARRAFLHAVAFSQPVAVLSAVWLRAYVYLPEGTSNQAVYLGFSDTSNNQWLAATSKRISNSGTAEVADIHSDNFPDDINAGSAQPTYTGEWVCVELQIDVGASARSRLYWNGEEVIASKTFDTRFNNRGGPSRINVGLIRRRYRPSQNTEWDRPFVEFFVDDVIAATTRPGCDG